MEEEEEEGEWIPHDDDHQSFSVDKKNGLDLPEESTLKIQDLYNLNDPQQVQSLTKRKLMNASLAKERLRRSILEAAADLTKEFHGPYLSRLMMTDTGQSLLDSRYPASSFDAVKKGFLFHLNSTGHYLVLREHLRHAVSTIIQQCGLIMRPNGFQNHRDFQKFLHDMYIYLSDEMHDTLNETTRTEIDPISGDPINQSGFHCGIGPSKKMMKHPEVSLGDLGTFAEEAMLEGDLENCHRLHLQRICRENCQSPQGWLDFAVMWCARGDDRMAEIAVRESLKLDPKCVNALLLSGIIAARHGDERAINLIGSALEICPLSPEIYVLLAAAHRLLGSEVNSKYFFLKARLLHLILTGRGDINKAENDFQNFSFLSTSSSSVNKNEKDGDGGGGGDTSSNKGGIKSKFKKMNPNDETSQWSGRSSGDKKKLVNENPKISPPPPPPTNEKEEKDSNKKSGRRKASDGSSSSRSKKSDGGRSSRSKGEKKKKKKTSNFSEKGAKVFEAAALQEEAETVSAAQNSIVTTKESPANDPPPPPPPVPKKPSYDLPIDVREDNISQMFLPMMGPSIQFTWDLIMTPIFGQPVTSWTMESETEEEEEMIINKGLAAHYQVGPKKFLSEDKEFVEENEILNAYQNFLNNPSTILVSQNLPDQTPRTKGQSSRKSNNNNDDDDGGGSSKELNSARKKKRKKKKKSTESVNNESGRSTKRSLDSGQSPDKKSPRRRKRSLKSRQKNKDDSENNGQSLDLSENEQPVGSFENRQIWTNRCGSEYIWTAQLLLQFHAHDFLDGVLARELFYTESRSVPFLYLVAMSLLNRKRERAALQFLEEAISYDTDNPYIWEVKGHCHHALGENELAIQCYQKSLETDPLHGHNRQLIYLRLGTLCADLNNVKLAKSVLLKGVSLYPSLSMWLALGNISYKMADYAEAEAAFAQANRRDNTNPVIWGQLAAVSLAQGSQTLAEQCYKWAVRFGLQEGKLMDEIKRLQNEMGYGDPSFPRVPECIPHDYYLKRLGRRRPLDIYREALETPPDPHDGRSRIKYESSTKETSREKELKRRLARWNQGTIDLESEEEDEDYGEVSQEEEEEEDEEEM